MKQCLNSKVIQDLRVQAGWDGKYPIPMDFGCATTGDFEGQDVVHFSADDRCVWIGSAQSAWEIFSKYGCKIIKDKKVLAKRIAYLENPVFKKQYRFWYKKS